MKIMHLISGGDSGGAKTHLKNLVYKLSTYATVTVTCLMEGDFYTDFSANYPDTVLLKQKNRMDMSVLSAIAKMLKEGKYDLLHVHGARANFLSVFLKKKIKIPIVTTMHSDYLLDFDDFFKKLIFTNMNRFALRKIDYFIAVSDTFADMLRQRNFRPNRIQTVYNGMDFSAVPAKIMPKADFAAKYGIDYDENCIYVGILARLDLVKDVATFVRCAAEASKQNPRLRFIVGGDGAERKKLEALAKSLDLENVLQFIGYVSDNYGFLNFIDINTLTSLCESFPYSMLEGAAMRLPIVASRVGGIPALVKNGETGYLFEVGNYKEMAEHILRLAEDATLRQRMGDTIYSIATLQFSDNAFAKRHLEMYANIISDYKDSKRYDVVLSGYYGFHNSGDDALLYAILNALKAQKPNIRPLVLSAAPKDTQLHYGVDAIARTNPFAVCKHLRHAKLLISGGGSLIQDETSPQSLWYYLTIIRLAKTFGLNVVQLANGYGPVKYKFDEWLCRKILPKCIDAITLRDHYSVQEIKRLGLADANYRVTADPALTLQPNPDCDVSKLLHEAGVPEKPFIMVSIRNTKNTKNDFKPQLAAALDIISRRSGYSIVFLPMQYPRDLNISHEVAKIMQMPSYIIQSPPEVTETMSLLTAAKTIIAMRLHTLIYAAAIGKDAVAIDYDPKIKGFMHDAQMQHRIALENFTAEKLVEETMDCIQNESAVNNTILKNRAEENTEMVLSFLEEAGANGTV